MPPPRPPASTVGNPIRKPSPNPSPSTPTHPRKSLTTSRASLSVSSEPPTRGRSLSYQDLSRCFHLPINTAAHELGVCVTALKKQCRKHGVPRWPHRKLKSLDKLKEKLEKEEATAADKEYYKHEIHSIIQKKDHIFRASPSRRDPASSADITEHMNSSTHSVGDPAQQPNRPPQSPFSQDHPLQHPQTPVLIAANPAIIPPRTMGASSHIAQGIPPQPIGPVPIPMPPVSLCGTIGCDCGVNGGVPSQGYHLPFVRPPIPPSSNSSLVQTNGPPNPSAPMPSGGPAQFYGTSPSQYPYAPYPPPQATYHNMVQVNVLEQQPYAHPMIGSGQPQAINAAQSAQGVASGGNGSPNLMQSGPVPPQSSPATGPTTSPVQGTPYELYTGQGTAGQAQNGFVYNGFPAQAPMPMDGMVQATQSNTTTPQMVPHYWTELPHAANPNNLVTMYNQTTHYHHHHAAESAANGHSVAGGIVDGTASSATNNSDAVDWRRNTPQMRPKDGLGMPTNSMITGSRATGARKQDTSRSTVPPRPISAVASNSGGANIASAGRRGDVAKGKPTNGIVPKDTNGINPTANGTVTAKEAKEAPRVNGHVEKEKAAGKKSSIDTLNSSTRVSMRNGTIGADGKDAHRDTAQRPRMKNGTLQTQQELPIPKPTSAKPNATDSTAHRPELRSSNHQPQRQNIQSVKPVFQANGVSQTKPNTAEAPPLNGHKSPAMKKSNMARSPSKRPRHSMGSTQGWGPIYISAGNTGVPVILQNDREVETRVREITPPSDREETPDNQDGGDGSGSGSGTGSGSGDGTGSGSGDGTGSGSGDGTGSGSGDGTGSGSGSGSNRETRLREDRRAMREAEAVRGRDSRIRGRAQERSDPPSPSTGMRGKRRKSANGHALKAWRLGRAGAGEEGAGVVPGEPGGAAGGSLALRARCFDQVEHQSVALGYAQWSVDKSTRPTSCMGSKTLLSIVGVAGHSSEGRADGFEEMRGRYTAAFRGQRVQWVTRQGRKQYLVVVAPFRKRGCAEVSGACGMVVEMSGNGMKP